MKVGTSTLFVVAVLFSTPTLHAAEAKDLVGTWVVEKSTDLPKGTLVEFTKEGSVKVILDAGGKKETVEGTFKVDGDKLNVVMKDREGKEEKETVTIKEVTKDKLVLVDKDQKELELKKK